MKEEYPNCKFKQQTTQDMRTFKEESKEIERLINIKKAGANNMNNKEVLENLQKAIHTITDSFRILQQNYENLISETITNLRESDVGVVVQNCEKCALNNRKDLESKE
jgi:uncharacterized protein (DUF927 family)